MESACDGNTPSAHEATSRACMSARRLVAYALCMHMLGRIEDPIFTYKCSTKTLGYMKKQGAIGQPVETCSPEVSRVWISLWKGLYRFHADCPRCGRLAP